MTATGVTGNEPTPSESASSPPLRHLHPLTPLFGSWRLLGFASALGYAIFHNDTNQWQWIWAALQGHAQFSVLAKAALVLLVLVVVTLVAGWLSWRVTGFAIVEDGSTGTLLYHRGVFVRQRRRVRLNRVQSVDVNQPFLPRLAGLAAVRLDMAAGSDSSVNLAYLRATEAWALRAEILRYTGSTAQRSEETAQTSAGAALPDPVERLVGRVSTSTLIRANLLDASGTLLVVCGWVVACVVIGATWGLQALLGALAAVLVVVVDLVRRLRKLVQSVLRDADFTLVRTSTGIRTSSGLTSTVSRTVDLSRIQGVRLEEPFWWRRFGWARVFVDIAGASTKPHEDRTAPLMPVAARHDALLLIAEVTGADLESVAPTGQGSRSRLLDPWGYRFGGVALLDQGAVTLWGRLRRHRFYVPYARVQSVQAHQGWLQRRLQLATVYLDPPQGVARWRAKHREQRDALVLVDELAVRARRSRQGRLSIQPAGRPGDDGRDHQHDDAGAHQPALGRKHRPGQHGQPPDEREHEEQGRQRER